MANQHDPDKVRLHVWIRDDLRQAAKARAERNGETLTDLVARGIAAEVDAPEAVEDTA